jgi:predicted MFS family arabinose efflux permease
MKAKVSRSGPAPFVLIALLALVQLLQAAGEGAARTFFNVYLDAGLSVATHQIGALFAAGQLLAVPAALVTPLCIDRWGNGRVFTWSSLGTVISLLPLALIARGWSAGLGFIGVMAMAPVWRTAFTLYRLGVVSPGWRALMNGASKMALGLSFSIASLGGGYIVTGLGYRSLFLTGGSLTAVGVLLFWGYFRVPRGELARQSGSGPAD